jgi:hypothetical protein
LEVWGYEFDTSSDVYSIGLTGSDEADGWLLHSDDCINRYLHLLPGSYIDVLLASGTVPEGAISCLLFAINLVLEVMLYIELMLLLQHQRQDVEASM